MSIFQRSVTCSFFPELYSHIDKNSGEKFEDMFLVKIESKETSLISVSKSKSLFGDYGTYLAIGKDTSI